MTTIEWTDQTWNPVTGCTKVSHGCKHCYAERLAPKVFAGQTVEVDTTPPKHPEMKSSAFRPRHFTDVKCHPERLAIPFNWAKPRRVFVNSMSDLFHEDVPFEFIAAVFAVMGHVTRHTYQVLTKRPARMLEFFRWAATKRDEHGEYELDPHDWRNGDRIAEYWPESIPWTPHHGRRNRGGYDNCGPGWPYENVWLGVSVEDQATADERIPLLLQTPAAVRFLSCEPLLAPIDIDAYLAVRRWRRAGPLLAPIDIDAHLAVRRWRRAGEWSVDQWFDSDEGPGGGIATRLHWVIAGGESGPKARPAHPDWFRSLRDQCADANVPFFFKQWGEWGDEDDCFNRDVIKQNVRIHDFGDGKHSPRVGKKAAGRLLDGRLHDAYPEPAR